MCIYACVSDMGSYIDGSHINTNFLFYAFNTFCFSNILFVWSDHTVSPKNERRLSYFPVDTGKEKLNSDSPQKTHSFLSIFICIISSFCSYFTGNNLECTKLS